VPRKSPVPNHIVSLGEDDVIFVLQGVRQHLDQAEQAVAARRNVGAVLNIAVRPETLRCGIVTLVEQRVKGLEYERLVLFR
jgi:hypothetical protein